MRSRWRARRHLVEVEAGRDLGEVSRTVEDNRWPGGETVEDDRSIVGGSGLLSCFSFGIGCKHGSETLEFFDAGEVDCDPPFSSPGL